MKPEKPPPIAMDLPALSKHYDEPVPEDQGYNDTRSQTSAASDIEEKPAVGKGKPYWQDSPDIATLHEYIADNRDAGATVVLSLDNEPAVRFDPGLSHTDSPGRWDKARHVLALFSIALPDIKHLLKFGMIKIPRGWSTDGSPLVRGSFPGP